MFPSSNLFHHLSATLFKPAQPHYHSPQQAQNIHLMASITCAVTLQRVFSVHPNISASLSIWHFLSPDYRFFVCLAKDIAAKLVPEVLHEKSKTHPSVFLVFLESLTRLTVLGGSISEKYAI